MTFLGVHKEVLVEYCKKLFEEVDAGVSTHEVICGASKYQDILGGSCIKGAKSMANDMID